MGGPRSGRATETANETPFSPLFWRALVPRKRQGRVKKGEPTDVERGEPSRTSVDRTRRDTVGGKGERVIGLDRWEKDRNTWNGRGTEVDGRWSKRRKKKNVVRDASQKRQRDEERGTELFPSWNLRRRCIR